MPIRWVLLLLVSAIVAVFFFRVCSRKISIPSGTIVFLGDSLTAGYGLDPGQAYPALIQINGMSMLNLGVSGSKTDDGLQRLKDYFQSGGTPRLVVVALGANDILQGVAPDVTETNLEGAVEECKSHDVPVMLCGVRIPGKFGTAEIFKAAAGKEHVPLLPDLLQGVWGHDELMQDNDVHPSVAGQRVIAGTVQAALLRFFSFDAVGQK